MRIANFFAPGEDKIRIRREPGRGKRGERKGKIFPLLSLQTLLLPLKYFQVDAIPLLFHLLFRNKAKGSGIETITEAGRGRPVREDMSQMGIAVFTPDLRPGHKEPSVLPLHDISRFERFGKARPSGPGIIFFLGAEQGLPGHDIHVNPLPLVVPVFILEGRLRPLFLGDRVLQGRQFLSQGSFVRLRVFISSGGFRLPLLPPGFPSKIGPGRIRTGNTDIEGDFSCSNPGDILPPDKIWRVSKYP